ncbi:MAG: P-loop NTPase [Candidatus Micrarchaeaceae archaeon]
MEVEKHSPSSIHPSFSLVLQHKEAIKKSLSGIEKKIGVYSAKGGVGKTTTAVNIAYSLAAKGNKVGILDADIDCPNLHMFVGVYDKIDTSKMPFRPIIKDGIKMVSTAMLVDDKQAPIIWRGPIIVKMLYDFLENTEWGELDYLIIDLPPGTSDAPLTIMQVLGLDGFVVVTTGQKIAAVNSIKSGLMAKMLNVPVIGVVGNMAEQGNPNVDYVAKELGCEVIGEIPYDSRIAELADKGEVAVQKEKRIAELYKSITDRL